MTKKQRKSKKRVSAILKLMQNPMFHQRQERDRTKYYRKYKHKGFSRQQEKEYGIHALSLAV